jgi:hypothetical protein
LCIKLVINSSLLTLYSTDLITPLIHEYNESPDSIYFGLN